MERFIAIEEVDQSTDLGGLRDAARELARRFGFKVHAVMDRQQVRAYCEFVDAFCGRDCRKDHAKMARYRQKSVEVEAVRYTGENFEEIEAFLGKGVVFPYGALMVETSRGWLYASPGEWLVRGVVGDVCSCTAEVFEAAFEPVDECSTVRLS